MSSASGNPSKTAGKLHAAKGDVKAGLGRALGSTTLTREGQSERAAGKDEVGAARANHKGQTGLGPGPQNDTGFSGTNPVQSGLGQPGYGVGPTGNNATTIGQGYDTSNTGRGVNSMPANDGNRTDAAYNTFMPTTNNGAHGPGPANFNNIHPNQQRRDGATLQDRQANQDLNRNAF